MDGKALAAALLVTQSLSAADSQPPFDQEDWRRRTEATLRTLVEDVTGPAAEPCGIAWLPLPPDPKSLFPSREKETAEALSCVRAASREGRGRRALWQLQGFDSTVIHRIAVTNAGEYRLLSYDSYPPGSFQVAPCSEPRLEAAPARIACGGPIAMALGDARRHVR